MAKGPNMYLLVLSILAYHGHCNDMNGTYNGTMNYTMNDTYSTTESLTSTFSSEYYTSLSAESTSFESTSFSSSSSPEDVYIVECDTTFPFSGTDRSDITTAIIQAILDIIRALFEGLFSRRRLQALRSLLTDDSFEIFIDGYNVTTEGNETLLVVNFYVVTTVKETVESITEFIEDTSEDGYASSVTELIEEDDTITSANLTLGTVTLEYEVVATVETTSADDSKSGSIDWFDTSTYNLLNWVILIAACLALLVLFCCLFRLCCWWRQKKEKRRQSLYEVGGALFNVDSGHTSEAETDAFNSDLKNAIELQQRGTLLKKAKKKKDPLAAIDLNDVDAAFDEATPFKKRTKSKSKKKHQDPNPIHALRSESSEAGTVTSKTDETAGGPEAGTSVEADTYDLL